MAGGAADCQVSVWKHIVTVHGLLTSPLAQYWETYLGIQCRLHELREKERISVAAASKYLANLVYSYKGVSGGASSWHSEFALLTYKPPCRRWVSPWWVFLRARPSLTAL